MSHDKTCPTIYGVDTGKEVTPLMVRDAIIECFRQAHCADAGIGDDDKETNSLYCKEIVEKAFNDAGGDFNNPSKEDILGALGNLAEFAKNFRNPKIIEKHYGDIMQLVNKL